MANCILSWNNRLQSSVTTITASSEASGLGANRLKDPQARKRWRTGSGVTNANVTFDMGSAGEIGVIAFAQPSDAGYYNADMQAVGFMTATDTVRHQLDVLTPGLGNVYDSGTVNGNWKEGYGCHAMVLPAPMTARYLKSTFNAASLVGVTGYLDMGLAWAGPAWTPAKNMQYGFNWAWQDNSTLTSVETSGLDFVRIGARRRSVAFSFDAMDATEAGAITQMSRLVATSRQVLFIPDPDDLINEFNQPIIGRLVDSNPISLPSYGIYTKSFTLLQSL